MPKYLIEREMPGVGELDAAQLREASAGSNKTITILGPEIQWMHSYVTADKLYCVYRAPSDEIIYEHARCVGIPADRVSMITTMIDPTTGE